MMSRETQPSHCTQLRRKPTYMYIGLAHHVVGIGEKKLNLATYQ